MVPRGQLAAALSDLERLRRGAEETVPRAEMEAARLADRLEVERLTRLTDTQVLASADAAAAAATLIHSAPIRG